MDVLAGRGFSLVAVLSSNCAQLVLTKYRRPSQGPLMKHIPPVLPVNVYDAFFIQQDEGRICYLRDLRASLAVLGNTSQ